MRVPASLAACLLVTAPLALHAQTDPWRQEAERRLSRTGETLTPRGYRSRGVLVQGTLFVDESRTVDVPVVPATEYLLAGSCDADCTGLSLVVSGPTGYQLDAARGGVVPVVRIRAGQVHATYRLTITMAGCRVSPCRYAVGLFDRPAPR